MKSILPYLLSFFIFGIGRAKEVESTWIFIPDDSMVLERPWRIIIYDDTSVVSQRLFFGCKSEYGTNLRIANDVITIPTKNGKGLMIRKEEDRLVLFRELSKNLQFDSYECVFFENDEWNMKFENAPFPPKNREEAMQVLDLILSKESKENLRRTPESKLIGLHFGLGMAIRNGFRLWSPDSQIVKNYGGGHPEGVASLIIKDYWKKLQKVDPNQTG